MESITSSLKSALNGFPDAFLDFYLKKLIKEVPLTDLGVEEETRS